MKVGRLKRPEPAMVIAVIALVIAMTGTAMAVKLKPHSIGPRQIQSKSVTSSKLADGAVTSAIVAKNTLTGTNFNLSAIGTVPSATRADHIDDSNAVSGHAAACPGGTILSRGLCYDAAPNGPIEGVKAAAEACARKGGRLPTPLQLLSVRSLIPLGNGEGVHSQFTDSFFRDDFKSFTVVVNSAGIPDKPEPDNPEPEKGNPAPTTATYEYVCVYQLIR
jgi:hypothetical protein